jgi:hypothetical protein
MSFLELSSCAICISSRSESMVEPGVLYPACPVQNDLQAEILMMRCRSEPQIVIFENGMLTLLRCVFELVAP